MKQFLISLFILPIVLFPLRRVPAAYAATTRLGIIGDSNSDEYRADDNRAGGTQYAATTLSWDELLVKGRSFSIGTWGSWGGSRRTGYEYNWALSGAVTSSMIGDGQHTGLAAQVAAGKIDYVIIYIGTNDFHSWNGTYDEVYNGTMTDAQLQAKINSIVSNITLAVDTVKQAGQAKIVVVNFADPGVAVDFIQAYPVASKRARVTNAITQINQKLTSMASSKGVTIANLSSWANSILSRVDSSGNLIVGGQAISITSHGDEPHHLQLGQGVGHLGTVGNGLMANFMLANLRTAGLSVTDFSDAEILGYAGIGSIPKTPTPSPTASPSCPSDVNQDRITDISDYSIFVSNFFKSPLGNARADINTDGIADLSDYSILVKNFLKSCP